MVVEVCLNISFSTVYIYLFFWLGGGAGGKKVVVEPHRHPGSFISLTEVKYNRLYFIGVFIARSKDDDMLLTKNMVVGESVYGEKRISVDVCNVAYVFS